MCIAVVNDKYGCLLLLMASVTVHDYRIFIDRGRLEYGASGGIHTGKTGTTESKCCYEDHTVPYARVVKNKEV